MKQLFAIFFKYRAHKKGYWNFYCAALQWEDVVGCLAVIFPNFDFVFLFNRVLVKNGLCTHHLNKY